MAGAQLLVQQLAKRQLNLGDNAGFVARLSPAGVTVLTFTFLAFASLIIAIAYTLHVVATLAFIEKEHSEASLALNPPVYAAEGDSDLAKADAITSRIRGTIGHLQLVGGFWARWRGLGCAVCIQLAYVVIAGIITAALKAITFGKLPYLDQVVGSLATSIALCHWRTAWTHIVISNPSSKRWLRRVPGFRLTVRNVWLATLVHELASRVAIVLPMLVFFALGLNNPEQSAGAIIGKSIPVALLALALYVLLAIPANVALTRVQASMLPDEDETIVPFDRSFGGKVDPAIIGGTGAVSFVDAWKSLTKQARNRVVRLCVKVVLVTTALYVAAGSTMAIELMAFLQGQPTAEPPQF